jgi:molecular chaperone GrpE
MKNDTDKIKKEEVELDEETEGQEKKIEGKKEIEELKQKIEELENNYKRALADYQNLQKRVAEERGDWLKIANRELILRLLPVLDTLMLGYKHTQSVDLKVMIHQFLDVLKAEAVRKIDTKDQDFDPQLMEVIETVEGREGKVLEEVRAGFMICDKLLRPAQVKVGKKSKVEN